MPGKSLYPYGSIKAAIPEWLEEAPAGKEFYYHDVAGDIGAALPTVSSHLLKIARTEGSGLVRGSRDGYYRKLDPEAANGHRVLVPARILPPNTGAIEQGDLLEVVGVLRSGALLLRAENGKIFRAEEQE